MAHQSEKRVTPERSLLLIAYYFPPLGMSGVQRTASLSRYLAKDGWNVTVLTAKPSAYFAFDQGLLDTVEEAGVRSRTDIIVRPHPGVWKKDGSSFQCRFVGIPDPTQSDGVSA